MMAQKRFSERNTIKFIMCSWRIGIKNNFLWYFFQISYGSGLLTRSNSQIILTLLYCSDIFWQSTDEGLANLTASTYTGEQDTEKKHKHPEVGLKPKLPAFIKATTYGLVMFPPAFRGPLR
jgi:hypothetical protein